MLEPGKTSDLRVGSWNPDKFPGWNPEPGKISGWEPGSWNPSSGNFRVIFWVFRIVFQPGKIISFPGFSGLEPVTRNPGGNTKYNFTQSLYSIGLDNNVI